MHGGHSGYAVDTTTQVQYVDSGSVDQRQRLFDYALNHENYADSGSVDDAELRSWMNMSAQERQECCMWHQFWDVIGAGQPKDLGHHVRSVDR